MGRLKGVRKAAGKAATSAWKKNNKMVKSPKYGAAIGAWQANQGPIARKVLKTKAVGYHAAGTKSAKSAGGKLGSAVGAYGGRSSRSVKIKQTASGSPGKAKLASKPGTARGGAKGPRQRRGR